jgi:VanZ family protein
MIARRWAPAAIWAAVILTLTSIPNPDFSAVSVTGADKVVHLGMYAVMGWLTLRAAWCSPRVWQTAVLVWLSVAAMGAVDEWHQRFIPGRSADPRDWLADATGAGIGIAVAWMAARRRHAERAS